jgi:lysophospholipase L1-like esterase
MQSTAYGASRRRRWSGRRLWPVGAAVALLLVSLAVVIAPTRASGAAGEVLILGSTVSGGTSSLEAQEITAQGFVPVVVDDATWSAMSTAQFASYRAIIIGDPTCGNYDDLSHLTAALSNPAIWGAAINGNVLIVGTDPVFHSGGTLTSGPGQLVAHGIDFALAQPGKVGAYIDLSCAYGDVPSNTAAHLLDGIAGGGFTVDGGPSTVCYNQAHIVAKSPALAGLTDDDLSNWNCSVHEAFNSWPGSMVPLAIARDYSYSYTASDGTQGPPYILAGGNIQSFPLSLTPLSDSGPTGTTHKVTAQLLDAATNGPVSGAKIVFQVTSGPNEGASGTCVPASCLSDPSGLVTWTYQSNGRVGDDSIGAFYDLNGNGAPDPGEPITTAGMTWTKPVKVVLGLGDSIAAGYGLGNAEGDPAQLGDNANAYPNIIAQTLGDTLYNYASSGACTKAWPQCGPTRVGSQTYPNTSVLQQISDAYAAGIHPDIVTLTVGADDLYFAYCLPNYFNSVLGLGTACTPAQLQGYINHDFSSGFRDDLRAIATDFPTAKVYITQLYNPFPAQVTSYGQTCGLYTALVAGAVVESIFNAGFTDKISLFNSFMGSLVTNQFKREVVKDQGLVYRTLGGYLAQVNAIIAQYAAGYSNDTVVPLWNRFTGHDLCAAQFGRQQWEFGLHIHVLGQTVLGQTVDYSYPGPVCPSPDLLVDPNASLTGGPQIQTIDDLGAIGIEADDNCMPHPTATGQQQIAKAVLAVIPP